MDMGKYVAVGVLAVIVLAAVTYEAPKKSLEKRAQARGQELQGSFGETSTPERTPTEPSVPDLPATPQIAAPPAETEPQAEPKLAKKTDELAEYTVKAGQTLCDIAGEVLGDRARWKEIYDQNKDRLPNPDTLQAGMKLIYKGMNGAPADVARAVKPEAKTLPASAPRTGRSYTVAKGDTLYGIARAQLGKGSRWKEIVSINGLDGEHLAEGTVLQLP